jgi:hypothetical protein
VKSTVSMKPAPSAAPSVWPRSVSSTMKARAMDSRGVLSNAVSTPCAPK